METTTQAAKDELLVSTANKTPVAHVTTRLLSLVTAPANVLVVVFEYSDLPPPLFDFCFGLVKSNLLHLYLDAQDTGWSDRSKLKEMRNKEGRYVIAFKRENASSTMIPSSEYIPLESDVPIGYLYYLICMEDSFDDIDGGMHGDGKAPVIYCMELQLIPEARNTGLGATLMKIQEETGRLFQLRRSMLTVFKKNDGAMRFYKRLGYTPDLISPSMWMIRKVNAKQSVAIRALPDKRKRKRAADEQETTEQETEEPVVAALLAAADASYAMGKRLTKSTYVSACNEYIGLRVPQMRSIGTAFLADASPSSIAALLNDNRHELRFCAAEQLVAAFKKPTLCPGIDDPLAVFLENKHRFNCWDIIDTCAGTIIGGSLMKGTEELNSFLSETGSFDSAPSSESISSAITSHLPEYYASLSTSNDFWETRIAIVGLQPLIKSKLYLDHSLLLLQHQVYKRHAPNFKIMLYGKPFSDLDLVNKAIGWMLREAGRVDRAVAPIGILYGGP
ncbi:hypothetical protein BCR33DRAFT_780334 [Rhizoclosmatium globosum]|uniref:N-alpha-acetyltransferase 40 n=1 Tax=Rhizoclosmatium globosum TaxID=329046 RepID=A0A1Y2CWE3_9FUNG|nr:hypothetical protein BCR33DRAFT_780334 [Rhizoclosmatium globosum]|eukprot:ORY51338.1 hypothetical protein BCR33DRAFT_780334 [Rhizoclosmatium globosum]